MEGFDVQTSTNHNWLPGAADIARFSYIPPLTTDTYTDGYLKGQAIFWDIKAIYGNLGGTGYNENKIPADTRVLRQCVWMKKGDPTFGSDDVTGFLYFTFGSGDPVGIYQNASDASLYAGYGPIHGTTYISGLTPPTIIGPASALPMSEDWTFYELWIDADAKLMKFYIGGALQGTFDVTGADLTGQPAVGIVAPNQSGSYAMVVDHWIVTDGDRPAADQNVLAVSVTASYDKFTSDGGLKGKLIINGLSYDTAPEYSTTKSPFSNWAPDNNTCGTANFLYSVNPETNAAWSALSEIDSWGVCTVNLGTDETSTQYERLACLILSYGETVTDPDGFPIVNYRFPSNVTYWAGNWTKQDVNKSYAGNVNIVPRPGGAIENTNYLSANTDSCILFPADTSVDDNGILDELGITFAQEYRTDYQDWDSVLGNGIPFDSYFITGYSILGSGDKRFQSNYVTVNYEELAVGQAYLQGVWDYALSGDTGRWSSKQQIYRFPGNYKHQMRRLKVRGQGRALQIKISSEDNKDFKINGWTIYVTGNAND